MYDKDDSGTIELSEMTDIIGTLYDMEGVTSSGGEGNISKPIIWFIISFGTENVFHIYHRLVIIFNCKFYLKIYWR